jgi:hypothetical protein
MSISDQGPFNFSWAVDQSGYEIRWERVGLIDLEGAEFVVARGGPGRRYQPLEDPGLWRKFAETCREREGVLAFANEFGLLRQPNAFTFGALGLKSMGPGDQLSEIIGFAGHLHMIAELIDGGHRHRAAELFNVDRPKMRECIYWTQKRPERLFYGWVPSSLRDALLHQIGEAITGNRQFRRCGNIGCTNWFRLGPHQAQEDGRRQTITTRRRFCSDYCRVAAARRQKKENICHA